MRRLPPIVKIFFEILSQKPSILIWAQFSNFRSSYLLTLLYLLPPPNWDFLSLIIKINLFSCTTCKFFPCLPGLDPHPNFAPDMGQVRGHVNEGGIALIFTTKCMPKPESFVKKNVYLIGRLSMNYTERPEFNWKHKLLFRRDLRTTRR